MLRLAIGALAVVVAALLVLAVLPEEERVVPEATIELDTAQVTLYPKVDPDAVWYFAAGEVEYQPSTRETTLRVIDEGERTVAGDTEFTIRADSVVIDRDDNLRGEQMQVHLLESEMDLDMKSRAEQLVLIDQRAGRFEIPALNYTGPGLGASNRFENVRTSFDLTDFEAGGPGTVGYNEFEDAPRDRVGR